VAANENKATLFDTELDKPLEVKEWVVEQRLFTLITDINMLENLNDLKELNNHIIELSYDAEEFNPAEQYLYLLAQALFIEKKSSLQSPKLNLEQKAKKIIALLSDIKGVSDLISKWQLSRPVFFQLHSLLAEQYVIVENFDFAYQERRSYFNMYRLHRDKNRQEMIDSLTDDFKINEKLLLNDVLVKQNESKIKQKDEIEANKKNQQHNFIVIIIIALIFIIIFCRQLCVRRRLIKLARTDSLTGLLNRNALFEYGYAMVSNFNKAQVDFSVLLLDLDNFKRINDQYGHCVGDQLLQEFAVLVNEAMRSRDIFARLGGEEFVTLLPYADNNKAKAIAQRINDKVSQHSFSALEINEKVTLSIGVATIEANNSFDNVLHRADLAMYQAKAQGKNRILSYQNISSS
jgi:diguanylate cyclase (GGDEF)-like protein